MAKVFRKIVAQSHFVKLNIKFLVFLSPPLTLHSLLSTLPPFPVTKNSTRCSGFVCVYAGYCEYLRTRCRRNWLDALRIEAFALRSFTAPSAPGSGKEIFSTSLKKSVHCRQKRKSPFVDVSHFERLFERRQHFTPKISSKSFISQVSYLSKF